MYPTDRLYTKDHEWILISGTTARVGPRIADSGRPKSNRVTVSTSMRVPANWQP